jgi:diguanylate cyclase
MSEKKPFEIARETLKQLSVRKLAPTPANYEDLYSEVSGVPAEHAFPAERLRSIAQELPARTPGQQRQKGLLDSAIGQLNWDGVKAALVAYGDCSAAVPAQGNASLPPPSAPSPGNGSLTAQSVATEFLEQVARLIEYALPALGNDDARFTEQTETLLKAMRQPDADVLALKRMLGNFGSRLSFAAEDQAEIRGTLLKLLHLIIANIGELSLDDRWLQGQIDALLLASSPPLTLRRLDDVERRLKDVIFKQTEAKGRAFEAQEEMRHMLATFIVRLSQMTESTSAFHGRM